jgi:hypothetical protein
MKVVASLQVAGDTLLVIYINPVQALETVLIAAANPLFRRGDMLALPDRYLLNLPN